MNFQTDDKKVNCLVGRQDDKKSLQDFERDFFQRYKNKDNNQFKLRDLLFDPDISFADIANHYDVSRQLVWGWAKRYGITGKVKRLERKSKPTFFVFDAVETFIERAKSNGLECYPYSENPKPGVIVNVKLAIINKKVCFPKFLSNPRDFVSSTKSKNKKQRSKHKLYWRVVMPNTQVGNYDYLCLMNKKSTFILPSEILIDKKSIYIPVEKNNRLKPIVDWTIYCDAWHLFNSSLQD